jgi:hypothetical protein
VTASITLALRTGQTGRLRKDNWRSRKAAKRGADRAILEVDCLSPTMPGLPKTPAANNISVDAQGRIAGLF